MANARKPESFVWTDDEVELLLRLPLDYKESKLQENDDWELCQLKYIDLMNAFHAHYLRESSEDLPHKAIALFKTKVMVKLKKKNLWQLQTGCGHRCRMGQGRMVMLLYEHYQEI